MTYAHSDPANSSSLVHSARTVSYSDIHTKNWTQGPQKAFWAATLLVVGLVLELKVIAQNDWPQWRGAKRDGSVSAAFHPEPWPDHLTPEWNIEVGEGYCGPVAARNRVWIHSRQGGREVVQSFALETGERLWRSSYTSTFEQDEDASAHGSGPFSTPALAQGKLFTLSVTTVLSAWDSDTGALLWRRDYSEELYPSVPYFGAAASPLVWGGLCFVHFGGQERGELGTPGRGPFIALNESDGSEKWRWNGDGPAVGASPVIGVIEGRHHLVFKTRENIVGLDPLTGQDLWRIPFKVRMENTIVTPLLVGSRLFTSDYHKGTLAWHISSQSSSWTASKLWENRRVSLFMSSPVMAGGQIVGFSHLRSGELVALHPGDGEILWRGAPRSGEHASLISLGKRLLVFLENGSIIVGEVTPDQFKVVKTYHAGSNQLSQIWAHPAVAENRIILRDGDRLVVYSLASRRP